MLDHHSLPRTFALFLSPSRTCPQCGAETEIFSNEIKVACSKCGFVIYNDLLFCVQWCKNAQECVGEETDRRLSAEESERPLTNRGRN